MSSLAMVLLIGLAAYVAAGIATAVAFVAGGVSRALPEPTAVTMGARVLLVPGAIALWPIVVRRWLTARNHP